MFGFGKRNYRKDKFFIHLTETIDQNSSPAQREIISAGWNIMGMQILIAFNQLRNGNATSQLSDDEFKLIIVIILQGMNEELFKEIDVSKEVKTSALLLVISDGYKGRSNIFNYYVEDASNIFDKIGSLHDHREWVLKIFNKGKKVWNDALNPDLSNRLTLANILENEDLVSNVKRLGIF